MQNRQKIMKFWPWEHFFCWNCSLLLEKRTYTMRPFWCNLKMPEIWRNGGAAVHILGNSGMKLNQLALHASPVTCWNPFLCQLWIATRIDVVYAKKPHQCLENSKFPLYYAWKPLRKICLHFTTDPPSSNIYIRPFNSFHSNVTQLFLLKPCYGWRSKNLLCVSTLANCHL